MSPSILESWRQLTGSPAFGLVATLAAYLIARAVYERSGSRSIFNPTLVAVVLLATTIRVSGLDYESYAQSAKFVTFLLSPAIVLIAVPLFRQRELIRKSGLIVFGALAVGAPVGAAGAVGIAWLLHADHITLLSIAPKSTTAGIAIGISAKIGGIPSLTAALVILTGIMGAVCGIPAMRLMGVREPRAMGLALGIASHGIGTAFLLPLFVQYL
jgi:putative effector of murein hydrolase